MKSKSRIALYGARITELRERESFERAYREVSEERRRKTDRMRMEDDKRRSLGAELLLRRALAEEGEKTGEFDFGYGENGKPYLKGTSIRFNLSHAGEYVLCAVAETEVGCDIEKIEKADLAVAKRFFLTTEYETIERCGSEDERNEMFYRIWTVKESFMKATGLGMKLPTNGFEVRIGERTEIRQTISGKRYWVKEFGEIPGYRCAVCGEENTEETELRIVVL